MKLDLDSSAIRTLTRDQNEPVQQHIRSLAVRIASRASQLAKKGRTGNLARRISVDSNPGPRPGYRVIADTPYARAVHEGSKPHIIRARNKPALHFFWDRAGYETVVPRAGGFRTHVTRGGILMIGKGFVQHPGTQGDRFLVRAMEEVVQRGV